MRCSSYLALVPLALVAAASVCCADAAEGPAQAPAADRDVPRAVLSAGIPPDRVSTPSVKSVAYVPTGHWAYPLLARLVARGVIELDLATLPVSRWDVISALLRAGEVPDLLSEYERWALSKLRSEFIVDGQVDSAVLTIAEGDASLELGLTVSADGVYAGGDNEFEAAATVSPAFWGGVGDLVGFYAEGRGIVAEQEGARIERVSERAQSWRGVTATADRAYVMVERPNYAVALGRRGPAWGHARWGRLLISGTAPTFDQIDARFSVGRFSFHALHARLEYERVGTEKILSDGEEVFLAAHRFVYAGRRFSVGMSEAVVYDAYSPEPVYVNPFIPYYLSQHNERANDNVLWSVDFVVRPAGGVEVYGELLVDDFMYERDEDSPDKYGFTLGSQYYATAMGYDVGLITEYSHVRKWVYTHKHVEHRAEHDGRPIGHDLGPDSDRLTLGASMNPAVGWSVHLLYAHHRKGEGRLAEPFREGEDFDPDFPSGVVESGDRVEAELEYQSLDRLFGSFGVAYASYSNRGNVSGEDVDDWEVRARLGVRL